MKKIISLFLIGFLCITLVGCNNLANQNNENKESKKGNIIETNLALFQEIQNREKDSIIYVGRPTCPACVSFYPTLEEVVNKYSLEVYYTNIDKWQSDDLNYLFEALSEVKSTPTVLILSKGEIKDMIVGSQDQSSLVDFLTNNNMMGSDCSLNSSC